MSVGPKETPNSPMLGESTGAGSRGQIGPRIDATKSQPPPHRDILMPC